MKHVLGYPRFGAVLAAGVWVSSLSFGLQGQPFRISAVERLPGNRVEVRSESDLQSYYLLLGGSDPAAIDQMRTMALGTGAEIPLVDEAATSEVHFYLVRQIARDAAEDSDGDGIDDVYELRHQSFLNPLDPADGALDYDGDGASNADEYRDGTDPAYGGLLTGFESSPAHGAADVAVTRETILRFTAPLADGASLSTEQLYAEAAGRRVLGRVEISSDRRKATLFYLEPLPGSARVRVTFDSTNVLDVNGASVDGDGDGEAGGVGVIEFDTVNLTPVANTAVVGRVFASELGTDPEGQPINRPLEGVIITVDGREETLRAVTDSQGNFRLEPAPSGTFFVHIDGRPAVGSNWPEGSYYPFVGKSWKAVAGRADNQAGGTGEIFLPLVVAETLQPVSATSDTTVTFPSTVLNAHPELTGVEVVVPANSLFDDNGNRGGRVGIAPVPPDRIPSPLPPGLNLPLVITVQTDGPSNFDRPVPVRFPNLPDPATGLTLAPGAKSALWSFNHDIGEWEVVGPMTVTEDGRFVVTDPGVGVRQPGWHGTQPGTNGDGGPPDGCGGANFNYDACRYGGALKPAADYIQNAAKVLSNPAKPKPKDAVKLLKGLATMTDAASARSQYCLACCKASFGDAVCGVYGGLPRPFGGRSRVALADYSPPAELDLAEVELGAVLELADRHRVLVEELVAILGEAESPDELSAPQRALFDAKAAEIADFFAPQTEAEFYAAAAEIAQNALATVKRLAVGQPPRSSARYLLTDLSNGVARRGETGIGGAINGLILAPDRIYQLELYFVDEADYGFTTFVSGANGRRFKIPTPVLGDVPSEDTDNDGLPDAAERVIGTSPTNPDTDGDGLLDGAEIAQGLDALGGLIAQTGVVASVDTPGKAVDICALNDLAIVADSEAGISVFNISSGLRPVLVAQVDTPGTAQRVACSGRFIGVADGGEGLAIVDISRPAQARITQQVPLGSSAQAVASGAGIAFVGLANGTIAAVDLATGRILETADAGGAVNDLAIEGSVLFAATPRELRSFSIAPSFLDPLGTVPNTRYKPESITGSKRLFVGGGHAYITVYPGYDVFDVRQPQLMQHVGLSQDVNPNSFKQIVLNGSGLGIAAVGLVPRGTTQHEIYLYDTSNPEVTTSFAGLLPTPGVAHAVSLYNGLAYVADGLEGLQIVSYLPYDTQGEPPGIALVTPFSEGVIEEGSFTTLAAAVTDDVQVRQVKFYVDGTLVATDGNFPFEHRFISPRLTPEKTTVEVSARAEDTGGNVRWSDTLALDLVPDATPPEARTVSPRDGAFSRQVSSLAAFFNEPLDPASVNAGSFELLGSGEDGAFGTGDDLRFTDVQPVFRSDVLGVFLELRRPLAVGRYQLTLTTGLRDLAGNPLSDPLKSVFLVYNLAGDEDGDCVPDVIEPALGLDPTKLDTDGDGTPDGDEDFDQDGLSNCGELLLAGTDPGNPDSNGNGIRDGDEDSDLDGITDGEEVIAGRDGFVTDPTRPDTDGDGLPDGVEVELGADPTNASTTQNELVVDGRDVTLGGSLTLNRLVLQNGAVIRHTRFGDPGEARLELTLTELVIDESSAIDVSGRGYRGGRSGGNPANEGRTAGNVAGSTRRNGGSYGGFGGLGNAGGDANPVYGDYRLPDALGSGGGSDGGPGGAGGGIFRLTVDRLQVDGAILAEGQNGSTYAGGGSGGSIWVTADTILGEGTIQALGGSGGGQSGGGSGGRVAIYAGNLAENLRQRISAEGGAGLEQGAPGSVYLEVEGSPAELVIRGSGRETPLGPVNPGESVRLMGALRSAVNLQALELHLENGAILTHPGATLDSASMLEIEVNTLTIDETSAIDVSGRGYLGGRSGANGGSNEGRTLGNVPGSVRRSGGSYGGLGAAGNVEPFVNALYGDPANPNELGSGGGSDGGVAGNGGGLLRLAAGTLTLNGAIRSDGLDGSTYAGGGSGGAIRIAVGTLDGQGLITANGGEAGSQSGGGGGGRVAVTYETATPAILAAIEVLGGDGLNHGAPGTIHLQAEGAGPELIIRGDGRETPFTTGDGRYDQPTAKVTLDNVRTAAEFLNVDELRLVNGAVLTQPGTTLTSVPRLEILANRLEVDASSRIDVSGRGYLGARSGANGGFNEGRTFGNALGSPRRVGGSYGGLGALGNVGGLANAIYGGFDDPDDVGSGGGADGGVGGNGGGLVRLAVGSFTLDGALLANGLPGDTYAGGGAGGGIRVQADSMSGNGEIRANGGQGFSQSGGGGGGRIALAVASLAGDLVDNLSALGGGGSNHGAPGTVFVAETGEPTALIIRGTGRETPFSSGPDVDWLLLDAANVAAEAIAAGTLELVGGAVLTHPGATAETAARLDIAADLVRIDAESAIDVSGRGYLGGRRNGNSADEGRTFGNLPGSTRRNGGSYGGLGGFGNTGGAVNATYGAFQDPNEPGSGGGADGGAAGNGGGILRLRTDWLQLDGHIAANGLDGGTYAGGGSGGAVRIDAQRLSGGGKITANGGNGGSQSGSGGGGRVAVYYQERDGFEWNQFEALAGQTGMNLGSPGSVYRNGPDSTLGALFFDARGAGVPTRETTVYSLAGQASTALTSSTLTDETANWVPGSLVGLELNPNTGQDSTFTIIANSATTLSVDPLDGDLTAVATTGAPYAGVLALDTLTIAGGARVTLLDADSNREDRVGRLTVDRLEISGASELTHPYSTLASFFGLDLEVAGDLIVDATSRIDLSARGYLGARRGENNTNEGRTLDNAAGSTRRNGGSHGGLGALGNTGGTVNALYGDAANPFLLGSGGGSDGGSAGSGGGRLRVTAAKILLDGSILANGGAGSTYEGGGSGGSLHLVTEELSGTGAIRADGGSGASQSGGGGGGRVAAYFPAGDFDPGNITAAGGGGLRTGGAGSVVVEAAP